MLHIWSVTSFVFTLSHSLASFPRNKEPWVQQAIKGHTHTQTHRKVGDNCFGHACQNNLLANLNPKPLQILSPLKPTLPVWEQQGQTSLKQVDGRVWVVFKSRGRWLCSLQCIVGRGAGQMTLTSVKKSSGRILVELWNSYQGEIWWRRGNMWCACVCWNDERWKHGWITVKKHVL